MDAVQSVLRLLLRTVYIAFVAIACFPLVDCLAGHPYDCQRNHRSLIDGSTRAAWSRTWHGPNAFLTPLSPYYIPRIAACAYDATGYGRPGGCATESCYVLRGYEPYRPGGIVTGTLVDGGLECAEGGFERLGQIPNDLDIAGPMPAGAPPR